MKPKIPKKIKSARLNQRILFYTLLICIFTAGVFTAIFYRNEDAGAQPVPPPVCEEVIAGGGCCIAQGPTGGVALGRWGVLQCAGPPGYFLCTVGTWRQTGIDTAANPDVRCGICVVP